MTLSLLSAILYAAWVRAHKETDWYLGFERQTPLNPALAFFTFIILYNNLIPISLIITLDIVKYVVLRTTDGSGCFCCSRLPCFRRDSSPALYFSSAQRVATLTHSLLWLSLLRYFQAIVFINNDLDMYHEETDTPPLARTSALNEELGQASG